MARRPLLSVHLERPMLADARKGRFNFLARLARAVEGMGGRVQFRPLDAPRAPVSLWHMRAPDDAEGALIFRRTYHYPFWHIEPEPERWRWPVARAAFTPGDPVQAADFAARLRRRLWPKVRVTEGREVLVPLQGRIRQCRSFQTMAPVEMLDAIGRSGLPAAITLHPREVYDAEDHAALREVLARHPGLRLAGDSRALLPGCLGVVTMNSAVAFDGFILGKPAVLFGQVDFHHVALNVADLGAGAALAALPGHAPDFAGYLHWFLGQAIDAMAPDAEARIAAALARCGWPALAGAPGPG